MGERLVCHTPQPEAGISDALNGMLYDDDHQIDELYAYRDFDKREPRAVVTVRRLSIRSTEEE